MVAYYVSKQSDLNNVIIPHFEQYPLLTQKGALFKRVVKLMHLSIEGISQIINIKASDMLKTEFSPVDRPLILTNHILNPN